MAESETTEHVLYRVRTPRVHVTYEVETSGAIERKELPFVMGVLGDFLGKTKPERDLRERRFVGIDHTNFDVVLKQWAPSLSFCVDNELEKDGSQLNVELSFRNLEDFSPDQIVRQVPALAKLLAARQQLFDLRNRLADQDKLEDNLGEILNRGRMAQSPQDRTRSIELIATFVDEVIHVNKPVSHDLISSIETRIGELDAILSSQVNSVLHSSDFQKLESSWRGLHYLVHNSETSSMLKIKVLTCTKKELLRNFKSVAHFDRSALFQKIYDEEYGVFGGEPFASLIGDFEFGHGPEDITILEQISHVAAAAHAPFIAAASAQMFGLESFTEFGNHVRLARLFDTSEHVRWQSFRDSDDSRYVGLTLPRVLARLPYGTNGTRIDTFDYQESIDGKHHDKYLWSNAAYAFGARLANAFARYGWCAEIRGAERGGLVAGLPVHVFNTDEGDVALKCPTEVAITDVLEPELAHLGFVPLVHCKGTDYAAFFSVQSTHKIAKYDSPDANANASVSAQLPYIFAASRFAHYIKSVARDRLGRFMTRSDVERFLNNWILAYVSENHLATEYTKCQYPLRAAKVDVTEIPGKPGAYRAVAFVQPHFELDESRGSVPLVIYLPCP